MIAAASRLSLSRWERVRMRVWISIGAVVVVGLADYGYGVPK